MKVQQILGVIVAGWSLVTFLISVVLQAPVYLQVATGTFFACIIILLAILTTTVWSCSTPNPEPSYGYRITTLGVTIFLSPLAREVINGETLFEWIHRLAGIWAKAECREVNDILRMLDGTEVITKDQEYIILDNDRKVAGYCYSNLKKIGIATLVKGTKTTSYERLHNLFDHEMSHIIAFNILGPINLPENEEEVHHKLFKEINLGC